MKEQGHEDTLMKNDGYRHIKTIVVYMDLTYSSPKEQEQEQALEQIQDLYGSPGDGNDLQPGDTTDMLKDRLGPQTEELEDLEGLKEGPGQTQSAVTFHPAMVAAKRMEKKIKDQLEESSATKQLRFSVFECVLFGTGVMKGPFALDKEYPNWKKV
jgi:hypothetical protein